MKKYLIILEPTRSGYSAYVPDLPGCIATGKTKKQVEKNMLDAIRFHLQGLKEEKMEVPLNKSEAEMLVFVA